MIITHPHTGLSTSLHPLRTVFATVLQGGYHESDSQMKTQWLRDFHGGPVVKNLPCNVGDVGELRSYVQKN